MEGVNSGIDQPPESPGDIEASELVTRSDRSCSGLMHPWSKVPLLIPNKTFGSMFGTTRRQSIESNKLCACMQSYFF